jgi:hypothetical protein
LALRIVRGLRDPGIGFASYNVLIVDKCLGVPMVRYSHESNIGRSRFRLCTAPFDRLVARLMTFSAYGRTISRTRFSSPGLATLRVDYKFPQVTARFQKRFRFFMKWTKLDLVPNNPALAFD